MNSHHRVKRGLVRNKVFYVAEILIDKLHDRDREAVIVAGTKTGVCRRGVLYILYEYPCLRYAREHAEAIITRSRTWDRVQSFLRSFKRGVDR